MQSTRKRSLPFHHERSDYSNQLHPRNRYYNAPPDFTELAQTYSGLIPYIIKRDNGTVTIDFKRPEAQRELAYCLLKRDFSIDLQIPLNVLCPMYLRGIDTESVKLSSLVGRFDRQRTCNRDDLRGAGASCIYPLLGCRLHDTWLFMATELQERLIEIAQANINRNSLTSRISLIQAQADHTLPVDRIMTATHDYDFCMCNPPFYASQEDFEQSATNKRTEAISVCHASSAEMVTPGGEVAFVTRMLEESQTTKTRIRWYTCMLGKRSSVDQLLTKIKQYNIPRVTATEFCQGRTRRWAVGWSYIEWNITTATTHLQHQPRSKRLRRTLETLHERTYLFPNITTDDLYAVTCQVLDVVIPPNEPTVWHDNNTSFTVKLSGNTWSRQARRARQPTLATNPSMNQHHSMVDLVLVVRGTIEQTPLSSWSGRPKESQATVQLRLDWLQGTDRQLFDSFAAHVFTQIRHHINKQSINVDNKHQ